MNTKFIGIALVLFSSSLFCGTYYSQFGQDRFINEIFFKNKPHGVFIEIGANDGERLSNTKFFEDVLGWTGICIEPSPVFKLLKQNRKCKCLRVCISDENKKADFMFIDSPDKIGTMYSGLVEKYDPRHLERIEQYFGDDIKEIIEVQCVRLNDVLFHYNIFNIDLLSLDTEGGELDILKSIDFKRINIYVIIVENNYNDGQIKEFLESKGYRLVTRLVCDEIYVKI